MKVLLIEDYQPLREAVARGLREAGFAVDATGDGREGLSCAYACDYDVIVLDLMLPGMDGLTILERLREQGNPVHVLVLTAKGTLADRVRGLNLGADDYLVKPFALEELLARVSALVRRKYEAKSPVLRVADLEIDTNTRTVRRAGKVVPLTSREYAVLELLVRRAHQVVPRQEIWDGIYDFEAEAHSNVIDVFIASLRRKLERRGLPRLIHTRRGIGYLLGDSC
jgi:two-component system copper resistance phosphate regulon response regulator CusR